MDLEDGQIGVELAEIDAEALKSAPAAKLPLGALLIAAGLIKESDIVRALAFQKQYGGRLGSIFVRLGAVSEEKLMPILSAQFNIPAFNKTGLPDCPPIHLIAFK